MRARSTALALSVVAATALAGCSTMIDEGKAEKEIRKNLSGQGARLKSVSCPGDKTAKKGEKYMCDVVGIDGTKGQVTLTQTDDKGNGKLNSPFLVTRKAEKLFETAIETQIEVAGATAKCPEIMVIKAGGTETCTITGADGTTAEGTITEKDATGNVAVDAPFVHIGNAERLIAQRIEAQTSSRGVKVDCPDIVVGKRGDTFKCQATGGNETATVQITQTNDKGGIDFKVLSN